MATKARLKSDSLLLTGEVDERLPAVTDGLMAHFPFDGSDNGISDFNILDYSTWVIGTTGSQTGFTQYGAGNSIIEAFDPFGASVAVWDAEDPDVDSNSDGGFLVYNIALDVTKMYRVSVWMKCINRGDANYYFRFYDASETMQNNDTSSTTGIRYPTWAAVGSSWFDNTRLDEWLLLVGHVFPYGNTVYGDHEDSGIYDIHGNKVLELVNYDLRFPATIGNLRLDILQYADVSGTAHLQIVYPRIDVIDGTEPKLEDLFNSEGNATHLSTYAIDSITDEGFAIEEGTTNIIPDGDFTGGLQAPYSVAYGTGTVEIVDDYVTGKKVLKHTNPGPNESSTGLYNGTGGRLATAASGQTWTGSIKVRTETPGTIVEMFIFGLDAANDWLNHGGTGWVTIEPEDGWVDILVTHTFSDALVTGISIRVDLNTVGTVYWSEWQLEQKAFATSFVNGSRVATAVTLPPQLFNIDDSGSYQFTISYEFYLQKTALISWNMHTHMYPSATGVEFNKINICTYLNKLRFRTGSSTSTATDETVDLSTYDDGWYTVTLVVDKGGNTKKGYLDGAMVLDTLAIHCPDLLGTVFYLGTWGASGHHANSKFRNLSFYNRALTDDEVKKLAKNALSIQPTGDILNEVTERAVIPDSTILFPFGLDGKNEFKNIEPVTENNTIYEDGSVFVSSGNTNLYSNADFSNGLTGWTYVQSEVIDLGNGTVSMRRNVSGTGNFQLYQTDISWLIGDIGTFSFEIKQVAGNDMGNPAFPGINFGAWGTLPNWSFAKINTEILGDGWYRLTFQHSAPLTADITSAATGFHSMNDDLTKTYHIRKPMLHKKTYSSPFVNGVGGVTDLHLPYDIIDCKIDFTIFGFWKPTVYADGSWRPCIVRCPPNSNDTYDRILIMNAGTSSTRLRCWHGSDGVTESSVYVPTEYPVIVDEWNFFALVRDEANMLLYIGNSGGFGYGTTATAYQLNADETGQVWHIGEYVNNESDAYHRDHGFVQRALSETELKTIFATNMRCYKDYINISNQVQEGVNL